MSTTTEQPQSQSQVAELLNELEDIEQQSADLSLRVKEIRTKLYQEKAAKLTPEAREQHAKNQAQASKILKKIRYQTDNGLTIHNLRQAGNGVSISHIRYADIPGVKVAVPIPSFMRGVYDFLPRGGVTYINIIKPNKEWISLTSVCHIDDSFDYKMGVKTALEQLTDEEAYDLLNPPAVEEAKSE